MEHLATVTTTESDGYARLSTPSPVDGRDLEVTVSGYARFGSKVPTWQVNWSAIGSVAPEVASAYAALLAKAAEYAASRQAIHVHRPFHNAEDEVS